jgi:murein DD-endopeptidase
MNIRHAGHGWVTFSAIASLLAGCAAAPPHPSPGIRVAAPAEVADPGRQAADRALSLVGIPYRYGGIDPRQGFDCSGLVYFIYRELGHSVPRQAQDQFRSARKIALPEVAPGDLMFFQDATKLSHVGIYVGDGLFVHAPESGRVVSVASLASTYYQEHLVGIGRLLDP